MARSRSSIRAIVVGGKRTNDSLILGIRRCGEGILPAIRVPAVESPRERGCLNDVSSTLGGVDEEALERAGHRSIRRHDRSGFARNGRTRQLPQLRAVAAAALRRVASPYRVFG